MKRALAICAAIGLFSVGAFGLTLSGSWTGEINLLPTLGFVETELKVSYVIDPFTITSTSKFTPAGYVTQSFGFSGILAFVDIAGNMVFDPTAPAYRSTTLSAKADLFGLDIGFTFNHWAAGYVPMLTPAGAAYVGTWCSAFDDYEHQTNSVIMYTWNVGFDPFSARVRFLDCSWGALFHDVFISFKGLPLCCGIYWDFDMTFTKAGFVNARFLLPRLVQTPVGWLSVTITYTPTSKSVAASFVPKPVPGIEFCGNFYWESADVFGFTIMCDLLDCNYAMFTTYYGKGDYTTDVYDDMVDEYGFQSYTINDLTGYEFERIALGFCGPGCCGPDWTVDLMIYFWDPAEGMDLTLFGLSRIAGEFYIPLMENFAVTSFFGHSIVTGDTELGFGWELTF